MLIRTQTIGHDPGGLLFAIIYTLVTLTMEAHREINTARSDYSIGLVIDRWWPFTHKTVGAPVRLSEAQRRWDWMRQGDSLHRFKVWKPKMTLPQYKSLQLLHEWWDDKVQPPHIGSVARKVITAISKQKTDEDPNNPVQMEQAGLNHSKYHEQLYLLFFVELVPEYWDLHLAETHDVWGAESLYSVRHVAMELAAMQRLAAGFIESQTMQLSQILLTESKLPNFHLTELLTLPSANLGATLDPCRWLKRELTRSELPLYLYDVQNGCTVKASKVKDPDYICISHTWGRVRVSGEGVKLSGTPWRIPCNTRFDIERLPDELARVFVKGYVWLDLLCIPQDRSIKALEEIARQGIIFQNAVSVIAWINDEVEWDNLRSTARWLACVYLHSLVNVAYLYPYLLTSDLPGTSAWLPGEPGFPRGSFFNPYTSERHPWLTSLWTLQEVCLRPDIAFCNRRWEPLSAGRYTIVTFDTMVILVGLLGLLASEKNLEVADENDICYASPLRFPISYSRRSKKIGELLRESRSSYLNANCFKAALVESRMQKINSLGVTGILSMAQLRHVTDKGPTSRAEAIMSAVGATDWYLDFYKQQSNNAVYLVNGLYPLPFIREIAYKRPFSFYGGHNIDLTYLKDTITLGPTPWEMRSSYQAIGSMVPFLSIHTTKASEGQRLDFFESPARECTESWEIHIDRSVTMKRAYIIKFGQECPEYTKAFEYFVAPETFEGPGLCYETPLKYQKGESLSSYFQKFTPSKSNYAISLCGSHVTFEENPVRIYYGILLKQVGRRGGTTILVKTGVFAIPGLPYSLAAPKEVDWLVL